VSPLVAASVAVELDPAREEAELRAYLGEEFQLDRLQHYQQHLDAEFEQVGHEDTFYLTSKAYLYNLTAFAMTGTKLPYLRKLTERVPAGARLLDYGCGIGADGLLLLEAGYRVEFADFDNPSVEYLRWRLRERGLDAPIHDLNKGVPDGFDAAYAFDVIEHVPDAFAFLREMEQRAKLVVVNFLEPEPGDQDLHHELPIRDLLAYVARHRLRHYALLHKRSHLVLYEPELASLPARLLHRARMRPR
jgi:2-polyprenyl-3-methyl-5-hydroxy-6-metoxy-1,4-benzoquinol methylase